MLVNTMSSKLLCALCLLSVAHPAFGLPKVLILHGGGGSADSSRFAFGDLASALSSTYEFVYAQAPTGSGGYLWVIDPPGGKGQPTTDPNIAAPAVNYLDTFIAQNGPFVGMMGYSQGSMFTTYYTAQLTNPTNTFQWLGMFCGYLPETHLGMMSTINANTPYNNIPALVFMGTSDTVISNAQTDGQAAKFTNPTRVSSSGSHIPPQSGDSAFSSVVSWLQSRAPTPPTPTPPTPTPPTPTPPTPTPPTPTPPTPTNTTKPTPTPTPAPTPSSFPTSFSQSVTVTSLIAANFAGDVKNTYDGAWLSLVNYDKTQTAWSSSATNTRRAARITWAGTTAQTGLVADAQQITPTLLAQFINIVGVAKENGVTAQASDLSVAAIVATNSDGSSGLSGGAIAGIVIGSVVGFALIAAVVAYFLFFNKTEAQAPASQKSSGMEMPNVSPFVPNSTRNCC